jgi:hypothetical protein
MEWVVRVNLDMPTRDLPVSAYDGELNYLLGVSDVYTKHPHRQKHLDRLLVASVLNGNVVV